MTDNETGAHVWTVGELRAALTGVEERLPVQVLGVSGAGLSEIFGVIGVEIDAARGPSGDITPDKALLVLIDYPGRRAT
ncbi:hypothetical protein [Streptomyces sp. YIM 132580]|uniref:hypothetical protein n=1 Tax=Streptomyces sp. YIM 132580 TaxID=2691958 RepID=UPI0013702626|nr:hypothetical protein [Streptomyces sp. YIM 132580]MXG30425.1 hypothetical protein [Streptomyces sp. YIM 132580]